MDACFAKFNRKIQRKNYDCGSGSMQRVYSGTGGEGRGAGHPQKNTKNKQNGNARIQELLKPVSVMENCHT